jgi:predicted DsbA family dithiol-disulfide isomerase
MFEDLAQDYDRSGVDFFVPIAAGLLQRVPPAADQRWLDVGCGPGAVLLPAAAGVGPAGRAVGIDVAAAIIERVTGVAAEEGITFHMDRALRANTLDCHRLLAHALHAHGTATQHALKQRLLDAYFTDGLDVGDHTTLARLATEMGVLAAEQDAMVFLQSGDLVMETKRESLDGMENGVSAVPTFVFEGKWAVPGAQDTEVFVKVLDRLLAQEDEELALAAQASGDACAVDGSNC